MIYSGIGSRKTPRDILEVMSQIAEHLASKGWTLRSGHAEGADQAFEAGHGGLNQEIYVPWKGYNGAGRNARDIAYWPHDKIMSLMEITSQFHPNWAACKTSVRNMHCRNTLILVGESMDTPSDVVICWTPNGDVVGGTGQALRMAEFLKIPIFNLGKQGDDQRLLEFIERN